MFELEAGTFLTHLSHGTCGLFRVHIFTLRGHQTCWSSHQNFDDDDDEEK